MPDQDIQEKKDHQEQSADQLQLGQVLFSQQHLLPQPLPGTDWFPGAFEQQWILKELHIGSAAHPHPEKNKEVEKVLPQAKEPSQERESEQERSPSPSARTDTEMDKPETAPAKARSASPRSITVPRGGQAISPPPRRGRSASVQQHRKRRRKGVRDDPSPLR